MEVEVGMGVLDQRARLAIIESQSGLLPWKRCRMQLAPSICYGWLAVRG